MIDVIPVHPSKCWDPTIGVDRYMFIYADTEGSQHTVEQHSGNIIDSEWRDALAIDLEGFRVIVCVKTQVSNRHALRALWWVLDAKDRWFQVSGITEMEVKDENDHY